MTLIMLYDMDTLIFMHYLAVVFIYIVLAWLVGHIHVRLQQKFQFYIIMLYALPSTWTDIHMGEVFWF